MLAIPPALEQQDSSLDYSWEYSDTMLDSHGIRTLNHIPWLKLKQINATTIPIDPGIITQRSWLQLGPKISSIDTHQLAPRTRF